MVGEEVGMTIDELDTPAVLVDLDVIESNIKRMSDYCREYRLQLRPRTKTHKSTVFAKMQLAAGACGITVAKPGEAEVMAEAGVDDILVAYPIVTPQKAVRIAELAERAKMRVALDSTQAIECVSRAAAARGVDIGVLVEIDGGLGRCGVGTPEESVALSRVADRMPGVRFDGLMFYPGHIKSIPNEQAPLIEDVNRRLTAHYAAFAAADIPLEIVSGGSTPTALRSHHFKGVTEIRPWTYAFLDRNLLTIGIGTLKECAVSVLVTVMSNAVNSRAIVDGGSKTFSFDPLWVGDGRGYGLILEQPDAELIGLSEEHGHLDTSRCARPPHVGEHMRIIPNHVCATINMHALLFGIRGDRVERTLCLDARGCLQ
jgi:D-serine deaminase-like pyridoxal phosphate-dependent protein